MFFKHASCIKMSHRLMLLLALLALAKASNNNPAGKQLPRFKQYTAGPIGVLTTRNGSPVEVNDTSTLNCNLIHNVNFMDTMASFVRERIPERVVHAKGAGAFGYFEVTRDITQYCKANLFDGIGKTTPVAVRFSPVIVERGGIDTFRDVKGFAIKFYTEEGNYDLAGLNIPVFPVKDPLFFPSLTHASKRNPVTNLRDDNMFWDFLTLRPESIITILSLFGDSGIPDGYRHMPGYGVHTFQVVNNTGDTHFIRFHILPDGGIKNLFSEEAQTLGGVDPDYSTRDLYNAIENGNYPSWTISIQILTLEDVRNADFNVFDITQKLSINKYPLHEVGRLVLDKNPGNYFADIEQLAYNPGNLVPGIVGAPDKSFEARQLSYRDAEIYRLQINFNNIPVNSPKRVRTCNYVRDGNPPVNYNGGGAPNYYPNSFNGPVPYRDNKKVKLLEIVEDDSVNFAQAREIYIDEMTVEERSRLVENILFRLKNAKRAIQNRAVKLFTLVHPNFGNRVRQGLQANATQTSNGR